MRKVAFFFSLFVLIVMLVFEGVLRIQFKQDIGGHLKRAADANTVELASKELRTALDNIERRGLMEGYTSVIYRTPDEDVGFWYQNLKASYDELKRLPNTASMLEKSNMLIKLRETLLDDNEKGMSVTVPGGISRFPYNALFGIVLFGAFISTVISLLFWWELDRGW